MSACASCLKCGTGSFRDSLELPPVEDTDAMRQLIGSSVTYRIALGPQAGRKALVLRTIMPLAGEDR